MLASDTEIRNTVLKLYDDVIKTFMTLDSLPEIVRDAVHKNYSDELEKLSWKRKELSDEPCQVVVSGEISSGKSSLLNFMIGTDVLPTSVLESRSIPCRLRHSPEKRADLVDTSGNVIERIRFKENAEALTRLKTIIEGSQSIQGLSHIDIFLEESTLQGNVVLVDTPGIKEEDDDDNTQLFYHLRKASAFIYIIKTDSAGGTHKIRKRVKELKIDGEMELNPDCILYVCNKWDQVDESEDERVFVEIRSRLRRNGIEVKDGQLLKLSVRKEKKKRQKGKPLSEQYELFIEKLRDLITISVKDRYRKECQWLERIIRGIHSIVEIYYGNVSKTLSERMKIQSDYRHRMASLEEMADKPKIKFCKDVIQIYTALSTDLHKHLRAEETCAAMIEICKSEIERKIAVKRPGTLDEMINISVGLMQHVINEVITQWREMNDVDNACAEVKMKALGSFRELEKNIEKELTDSGESASSAKSYGSAQAPVVELDRHCRGVDESEENQLFTRAEKVGITLTMPLWFPIAITASLFVIPVGLAKVLSNKLSNRKEIANFRENMTERLMDILQYLYETDIFTKDRFFEEFDRNQIRLFNQWIDLQHQNFIREMEVISNLLDQLAQEVTAHAKDNVAMERFLEQLNRSLEECSIIASKYNTR